MYIENHEIGLFTQVYFKKVKNYCQRNQSLISFFKILFLFKISANKNQEIDNYRQVLIFLPKFPSLYSNNLIEISNEMYEVNF